MVSGEMGSPDGRRATSGRTAMSIRITNKAVEVYDADNQLIVWELHHASSRKSAAFYLGTVCEVYGINDADLNAQIIAAVKGE